MVENALTRSGFNSHIYFVTCKNKVLARFNCAILIHTLPGEKLRYVFTTTSKARVFLGNYNFASSSPLRVGSVEIII